MSKEQLMKARAALATLAPNEFAAYEEVEAELEAAAPDEGPVLMVAVFKAEAALAALVPNEFAAYEKAEAAYKETLMMRGVFKAEAALATYEKAASAYREMLTEESWEAHNRLRHCRRRWIRWGRLRLMNMRRMKRLRRHWRMRHLMRGQCMKWRRGCDGGCA